MVRKGGNVVKNQTDPQDYVKGGRDTASMEKGKEQTLHKAP